MVAFAIGVTVMPASSVDGIAADDPLLRVRPLVKRTPTRRIGPVWRSGFSRHKAIDAIRQAVLNCQLPGSKRVS